MSKLCRKVFLAGTRTVTYIITLDDGVSCSLIDGFGNLYRPEGTLLIYSFQPEDGDRNYVQMILIQLIRMYYYIYQSMTIQAC
jgi:hypothetical protein